MEESGLIPDDLDLNKAFKIILTSVSLSEITKDIARLICDNSLSTHSIQEVIRKYHLKSIIDIKEEMLDLILKYINIVLIDNKLSQKELTNVKILKTAFKIREYDFYRYRHHEIKEILYKQFVRIYRDDNKIDDIEALHKVDLQELFSLSYDQFLEFANDEDISALERGADVLNLDTFIPHNKFGLVVDELAQNQISQEVKDSVMARYEGKCSICQSTEDIDFDHIVPILKGGSNTARNIQLLCRKCRIEKIDE